MRTITSAYRTAIQQRNVNTTFLLIDIDFSTTVYYTTLPKSITWNSNTYTPSAGIVNISAPQESTDFLVGTIELIMSGANQSNIALALSENYNDKQVIIRRAILNDTFAIIADPVTVFDGRLNSYEIEYAPVDGKCTVKWMVTSHWADFARSRGRYTNNESQQSIYPGDTGLEFAAHTQENIEWGKE